MQKQRKCGECVSEGIEGRPAPYPGPRCFSHDRDKKKAGAAATRDKRLRRVYGITGAEADLIQEQQGGTCICGPWTGYNGKTRALSTDHNHETGLVRGRLCKHCNDLLGRVADDPAYFIAMLNYLANPPAVQVLGERYVPR